MCANDAVRNLAGGEQVNEACLDLQQKARKAAGKKAGANGSEHAGCPYHRAGSADQRDARQASVAPHPS